MSPLRRIVFYAAVPFLACGLLLTFAACKAGAPEAADELAGVIQFVANGSFELFLGEY